MSAMHYFNPSTEKHFPDLMAGCNAYCNDNLFVLDKAERKTRLPDGWENFDEVCMTAKGPIGINKGQGFVYLDPDME